MKFVDSTEIYVRSGRGGRGMVSFAAAKGKPKMGCDGGDGGDGGSVYLVGNSQLNTLSALYYRQRYDAGDGAKGGGNNRTGARGEDKLIPVPLGTVALNSETGKVVAEVLHDGEKCLIAKGGEHGMGNARFVTSTHQMAEEYTLGQEGVEMRLKLELKLIADVGLAGFPNAGKSTLLSRISAARPKIADYPFTTLVPNLGVVDLSENSWGSSFVMADIPGLIEGASEGRGLGHEFLKHLERTKIVAFVVAAFTPEEIEPGAAFETLRAELQNYSPELARKRAVIIVTKADLAPDDFDWDGHLAPLRATGLEVMKISSVRGEGIRELKFRLNEILDEERQKIKVEEVAKPEKAARSDEFEFVTRADEDADLGL